MISDRFPRAEIKLLQTDVSEFRNNFISHVTTALVINRKMVDWQIVLYVMCVCLCCSLVMKIGSLT